MEKSRQKIFFFLLIALLIALMSACDLDSSTARTPAVSMPAIRENTGLEIQDKPSMEFTEEYPEAGDSGISLLFLGDLMIDRHVGEKIKKYGFDYLFADIKKTTPDFFSGYNLISANLEGAVTDRGARYKPDQAYDFAFAPELINKLHDYNFSFFNLANNHLSDQGERGIIETENNLKKLDFLYSGCADGQAGKCSQIKFRIGNIELGMAGFSMVYRQPSLTAMTEIVAGLASTTDLVIVNIHWGTEYEHKFSVRQQEIAHSLIDSGADIIIGHHPHVVQGMEVYETRRAAMNGARTNEIARKPIFYSLGNFIFDQYFSPDTQEELAVKVGWEKSALQLDLIPLRSVGSQPQAMSVKEQSEFFNKFIGWSKLDKNAQEQIKQGKIKL